MALKAGRLSTKTLVICVCFGEASATTLNAKRPSATTLICVKIESAVVPQHVATLTPEILFFYKLIILLIFVILKYI